MSGTVKLQNGTFYYQVTIADTCLTATPDEGSAGQWNYECSILKPKNGRPGQPGLPYFVHRFHPCYTDAGYRSPRLIFHFDWEQYLDPYSVRPVCNALQIPLVPVGEKAGDLGEWSLMAVREFSGFP